MSYSEIMIQAYAEEKGITREEAIQSFGVTNPVAMCKKIAEQLSEPKIQGILSDLHIDPKGILAGS